MTTAAVERFERRLTEESSVQRLAIADLRTEIRDADIALRLEFWVGQVFAVAGVVAVVLRLMRV